MELTPTWYLVLAAILFAIGAGYQVVAVDAFSYYPEEAPVTDLSGFTPNVEAILAFEPDLVVLVSHGFDDEGYSVHPSFSSSWTPCCAFSPCHRLPLKKRSVFPHPALLCFRWHLRIQTSCSCWLTFYCDVSL